MIDSKIVVVLRVQYLVPVLSLFQEHVPVTIHPENRTGGEDRRGATTVIIGSKSTEIHGNPRNAICGGPDHGDVCVVIH